MPAKEKKMPVKKRPKAPSPQAEKTPSEKKTFPIIGIGASAGGLAAFEKFFTNMPADSGMAFVLVQHMNPTRKSMLAGLVQKYTDMRVMQSKDRQPVEPDHVYIIPPNKDLAIFHGALHPLDPVKPYGRSLPIDFFFRSLAEDLGEHAICLIFSGNGADGTLGLRAIKEEGGLVMVQEPETAEYDGMPGNARGTGLADYVLPAEQMPAQLLEYTRRAFGRPPIKAACAAIPVPADDMQKILMVLRSQTGHDFACYKQNTITRRVERRMALNELDRLSDYVRFLRRNPLEVEKLFGELLIGVTAFFRDPEAFDMLKNKAIPALFENRRQNQPLRVWVAGCASGEEAYSIAILIQEQMTRLQQEIKVQIFATDIDNDAIERARTGRYPESIAIDVPKKYLDRFFIKEGNTYLVAKQIRELVVFATQSLLKDPPFSKLDLLSCRNLLICLNGGLQKKIFSIFHYALNPHGFLFLGNSESIGEFAELFGVADRKWKLFKRQECLTARNMPGNFSPPKTDNLPAAGINVPEDGNARVVSLSSVREHHLQTAIKELETSNEELQSANEELQCINEEQQSVNEELVMVNTEYKNKINELSQANNDLNNLLSSTNIATIFVDDKLIIKRFTPAAAEIINLIPTDVGRPVSHIVSNLIYEGFSGDVNKVLDTLLIPLEKEVQTKDGSWYLMRITPYRTLENVIDGAVITFVKVTEQKQSQEALRKSEARYRSLLENSPDHISIVDRDGVILFANRPPKGLRMEDILSKTLYEFQPPESQTRYRDLLARVFSSGRPDNLLEMIGPDPVWCGTRIAPLKGTQQIWHQTRAIPFRNNDRVESVVLISTDVTRLREMEGES
ncbi:MAG: PAS domain-containing protein [Gammaproteobacteria bacterium]|nr:PAS domain-containing protein [Gammaproteobacteria bacterium]